MTSTITVPKNFLPLGRISLHSNASNHYSLPFTSHQFCEILVLKMRYTSILIHTYMYIHSHTLSVKMLHLLGLFRAPSWLPAVINSTMQTTSATRFPCSVKSIYHLFPYSNGNAVASNLGLIRLV